MGCATHVLVENILSIIAASVLLYFDNLFLNNPYICLYGSTSDCNQYSSSYSYSYSYSIYNPTYYTVKLACIKAQLACASLMLFTNVIYIIIFIVVAVKTKNESNEIGVYQSGTTSVNANAQPIGYQRQEPTPYVLSTHQQPGRSQTRVVECHKCHTLIEIA